MKIVNLITIAAFAAPLLTFGADGRELFSQNCTTCHKDVASGRAPTAYAVIQQYKRISGSKPVFIKNITGWASNPNPSKSALQGASHMFGAMPKLALDKESLASIAEFMWSADFKPGGRDWRHCFGRETDSGQGGAMGSD